MAKLPLIKFNLIRKEKEKGGTLLKRFLIKFQRNAFEPKKSYLAAPGKKGREKLDINFQKIPIYFPYDFPRKFPPFPSFVQIRSPNRRVLPRHVS